MQNKKTLFVKITILLIVVLFTWFVVVKITETQNNIKINNEIDEFNKDVLLKLEILYRNSCLSGEKHASEDYNFYYYYIISCDGTLTTSYGEQTGLEDIREFRGLRNPNYAKTTKLTDNDISELSLELKSLSEQELLGGLYSTGYSWIFSFYYNDEIYTFFNGSYKDTRKEMFELIDKILNFDRDCFNIDLWRDDEISWVEEKLGLTLEETQELRDYVFDNDVDFYKIIEVAEQMFSN